jgi:hypothetical protein
MQGMTAVWVGVALVASVVVVAKKAYAQSATFTVFKHKVNLQPGANFKFTVATNEPVNCKCTTNFNRSDAHGVGELAFTADNLGTVAAPNPRISYVSWSSNGNEHSGSLCPPSVVDTGFLTGAVACPGGLSGQNQTGVAAAGGGPEPSGGGLLTRCSGKADTTATTLERGVFIETASAITPNSLRLHNHLQITVPARVTCIFMDLK